MILEGVSIIPIAWSGDNAAARIKFPGESDYSVYTFAKNVSQTINAYIITYTGLSGNDICFRVCTLKCSSDCKFSGYEMILEGVSIIPIAWSGDNAAARIKFPGESDYSVYTFAKNVSQTINAYIITYTGLSGNDICFRVCVLPIGKIVDYTPPEELEEGEEVRVPTTIENGGDAFAEFRMFLFDDDTDEEIEHEPKYTWKNLNPGEEYSNTLDTDWWWGAMPDHDWNLRVEVRHQATPDTVDDIKTFTVKLKGAPQKDTKLTCYDKETVVDTEVNLEAKLEEVAFPYIDIEYGNVKFYINNVYVGEDLTDDNGKAYVPYTPPVVGTFTIKAVFEADGDYNGSECTATLIVNPLPTCEYADHASDAKFVTDAWVYPERALVDTKADVVIVMDVLQAGMTRYKFVVTREWDGIVEESTEFLKGYWGHYADTYRFTMPDQDAALTVGLYRCNENGMWELCPGTTFPGGPTEHTITIAEGVPIFEWICWRTFPYVPLTVNRTTGVVEGKATIQAGGIGCLTAHRVDGIVPITIKNLTTEKEMTQNTDATGYLYFEFPLSDCVEGENEFQLVSGEVASETKIVNTQADVVIGKIISCQTEVPAGDYGVFGWDLKVPVKVQNQGGKTGEFRVYFMNITTGKKEDVDPPDLPFPLGWWDNIGAGKTKEYTLESSSVLTESMELEMQLWQQEKWGSGGEPDDVAKITVVEEPIWGEFPIKQVALYGGLALGLYAGGSIASSIEHPTAKSVGTVAKVGAVIPTIVGIYYAGRWAAVQIKKIKI